MFVFLVALSTWCCLALFGLFEWACFGGGLVFSQLPALGSLFCVVAFYWSPLHAFPASKMRKYNRSISNYIYIYSEIGRFTYFVWFALQAIVWVFMFVHMLHFSTQRKFY